MLVIRKYHQSRPFGMQTFLSRLTVILTKSLALTNITKTASICITEIVGPFQRQLAMSLVVLDFYFVVMFYLTLTAWIMTKYASIYHGFIVEDLDEDGTIQILKKVLVSLPVLICIIEYFWLSTMDNLTNFQLKFLGYEKSNSMTEWFQSIFILVDLGMMALLHARIEYDAFQFDDTDSGRLLVRVKAWFQHCWTNGHQVAPSLDKSNYNMATLRRVALCGIAILSLHIYHITINVGKWKLLVYMIVLTAIGPLMFVVNHQGMKNTALKILRTN